MLGFLVFLAGFVLFLLILYVASPLIAPKPFRLRGSHVLVTGGSSGIGKAVAIEVAKRGAKVTLLARNQHRLTEAKADVEQHMDKETGQEVLCISVDLAKDYTAVEKAVKQAQEKLGPVDMLVNCAGFSISGRFEDIPVDDFQKLIDLNYKGCVYATKAVISDMKARSSGRIVFVSSQAGQLGLYGFSAYSASKFAVRGLAEALQMEVKPYNIRICLAFPPDTDTPGYAEENLTKPKETRLISETAGLFQPDYVAKAIVDDTLRGRFLCYMGIDGYMLASLTSGFSPVISIMEATQQVVTMGLFRIICLIYLETFDRIVQRCKDERERDAQS